jgi:Co/Zn/Cd efflux system component
VDVHDIHVWSLTIGVFSGTCHLDINTPSASQVCSTHEQVLQSAQTIFVNHGIKHSTIQIGMPNNFCPLAELTYINTILL